MISKLKGQIESISGNIAVIDVQGVGYEVHCTRNCLSNCQPGKKSEIIIYTEVKEDLIRLFGFEDQYEKQVFSLLMQVKGIGPRTACELISKVDKTELVRYIGRSELSKLQSVKGIGKKTAERIIVELRDKIGDYVMEGRVKSTINIELETYNPHDEAIMALIALGFSKKDAERAIEKTRSIIAGGRTAIEAGEIVKEALKYV